ncbi:uncharacterized protein [Amphiura filiformis]|uniref:uncharacterized protein isoform X2 n=1 Tax=Amphiura filiformis TaxID=82378 RepID=UPI003B20D59A
MSSQAFPPQGGGGTTKTHSGVAGGAATITMKANATATTNNGKDLPKTDAARTQLLADKQEGPRVVVQPAYPPMPKAFTQSSTTVAAATTSKITIPVAAGQIKAPTCYIIPATKGPQGSQAVDMVKATTAITTKLATKQQQHIPVTRSLLGNPATTGSIAHPATQKIVAPVRIPGTTTTSSDGHHPRTVVAGLVTSTQVKSTTIPGLPSTQAITAGGVLPHGVLATMPFVKGVHPMHTAVTVASAFPSHLPRGAAAAAAMTTAPRAGLMTTALRATIPVGSQVTTTTSTIIPPSILQHPASMQRVPTQVHLPAQVHNRLHSPATLPGGTTVIPRVPSPAVTITHATAEPHRTVAHAAALQSLAVSAAQARSEITTHATTVRTDIRTDTKLDAKYTEANVRAEVRTGTRQEVRQPGRVEVRTIDPKSDRTVGKLDPRTDIRAGYTYQLSSSSAAINAQKHSYMANLGIPRQQLLPGGSAVVSGVGSTMIHTVANSGATSVSNTAVTTQSTVTAVVRTTAVTGTTMSSTHPSTHPSTTSSNIPIAKVYPQQQHTTRPSTEPSPTAVYLSQHRNSPNNPTVTSVSGLPVSVSMSGDARTERGPHQTIPSRHHFPAAPHMPYYFSPEQLVQAAPYHNMMRYGQHGPLATMPNTMVRPTIDSHTRLPVHATTPNQNSSVAAAVAAAAHAATVASTPPVRLGHHGPLTMMIEPRSRQVTMQNSIGGVTSSAADGIYSTGTAAGQTTPSSMAIAAAAMTSQQQQPQQQQQQQQQQEATPNPASSPRPKILQRKRAMDRPNLVWKPTVSTSNSQPGSPGPKTDLSRAATNSPKATDSLSSSQHSVDSNISEASTDTVPTPSSAGSVKIKQEPDVQGIESGPQVTISTSGDAGLNATGAIEEVGPSPRKKPRKQQHIVATEHPDILDDQSTDDEMETKPRPSFRLKKERKDRKHHRHQDMDSMKIVHYFRRPCCRLLDTYRQTWKPTHNHFDRYTDVKPKEEKRISIHEIANQRGVLKKTDGWKIRHITYQFEDLGVLEQDVHDQMNAVKDGLVDYQTEHNNKDTTQIYELIQGNIQRSKYVMEHLDEAKISMLKLLEHKPKVLNIIKKHANKRHAKKKSHSS